MIAVERRCPCRGRTGTGATITTRATTMPAMTRSASNRRTIAVFGLARASAVRYPAGGSCLVGQSATRLPAASGEIGRRRVTKLVTSPAPHRHPCAGSDALVPKVCREDWSAGGSPVTDARAPRPPAPWSRSDGASHEPSSDHCRGSCAPRRRARFRLLAAVAVALVWANAWWRPLRTVVAHAAGRAASGSWRSARTCGSGSARA